jgi:outer membrane protein assembly factor BamB
MSLTRNLAVNVLAICLGCNCAHAQPAELNQRAPVVNDASQWPLFRGNVEGQGIAAARLPETPQVLWRFKALDTTFEATAVIAGDTVFVGDGDRAFHALSLSDGKPRWSIPVDQGFQSAAAVRDGRVYVGDAAGIFHCFDVKDGRELWRFETGAAINSSPTLYEDSVLFGSQDGSLYRLRGADGNRVWKYSIKAEGGIQSSPTLSGRRVMFAGCDGQLHVIDVVTGEKVSTLALQDMTLSSAAIVGSSAYLATQNGEFLAIDWQKPAILWRYRNKQNDAGYRSSAAASTDWVITSGRNKIVERLSTGGQPVWSFSTAGRIDSSPVVAGERVYFGSADGRVYGVTLDTGQRTWKYDTGGAITASPSIAQDRLVIGNENGVLFCFGAPK